MTGLCQAQEAGGATAAQIFDKIYSNPEPPFNTEPSAFLARVVDGVTPGEALDVAMGQGRNSLFLARKGWRVTGYDISPVGLAQATKAAAREGLALKTQLTSHEAFDFGKNRWDLVVMIFPGTSMEEEFVRKVKASVKPGGLVVVEQFNAPPVGDAIGPANALFRSFQDFRVLKSENARDISDWGRMKARIGRILAAKE
jgi:2-polyprenyl-3-methyl-5-hydroxy-6-metoxy-1,4-benzoquinol methylase